MKRIILLLFLFALIVNLAKAQTIASESLDKPLQSDQKWLKEVNLKHKIVPLNNPVYQFLDHCEATGKIDFLPQARPYTKVEILKMILGIANKYWLTGYEKAIVDNLISDFSRESNGLQIHKQDSENSFALLGVGAETSVRMGAGNDGAYSTSSILLPFISGDVGDNLTFHGSFGASIERLAPDIFYQSYTKDGTVNFPYQSIGYAYLPYQFNYETMYPHVYIEDKSFGNPNVTERISEGMIYYTEMGASWMNGAIQMSLNNQRRAWGHDEQNLVLSSTARRFSGIEFKVQPATWLRYSILTGSLFSYTNQQSGYKQNIYGYDVGQLQNLFTLQLIEYNPTKWMQISATTSTIWWKRFELSYFMPLAFSHFSQIETGDYDNQSLSIDLAFRIPGVGKTWFSFFNDEFSFTQSGPLLKMPRNRYAWQLGIKSGILSEKIPGTYATLKYTRLTPFVYTHYTETRMNAYVDRPFDMTYTHDGFNLGFYLPPNSSEFNLKFVNIGIPDLIFTLDNKLIIHGTNDLSSSNILQIYGDVYRHQVGDIYEYPLLNFTKDGNYDWSVLSDFRFDWKVRGGRGLDYFRVVGSVGFAGTWWVANGTGITSPGSRTLFTGSLGVIIDI